MGANNKRKTTEEFIKEAKQANSKVEVIGEYINNKTKIKCRCVFCNKEFNTLPGNILRGNGCKQCASQKTGTERRKTHEKFLDEMQKINSDITILGQYVKTDEKLKCQCKICNNVWYATPHMLKRGRGCPQCAKQYKISILTQCKYTKEEVSDKIAQLHPNITIVGEYINVDTYTAVRCADCGSTFTTKPSYLLSGRTCRVCSRHKVNEKLRLSHDEFITRMHKINPDIKFLTECKGFKKDIICKCSCGHIWTTKVEYLLEGYGCPKCNNMSVGENRIYRFLKNNNIVFDYQKRFNSCRDINTLPFDFYLPDYNICLEYDGEQHYWPINFGGCNDEVALESFNRTQKHDKIKTEYCNKNNIRLIRISYKDYNDIEKILKLTLKI